MMDSSLRDGFVTYTSPTARASPVYEAVVNSIESIEELNAITQLPLSEYQIDVEIIRDSKFH